MSERRAEAHVGDIQAYGRLLNAFFDHVCPKTGTIDYVRGESEAAAAFNELRSTGHPVRNLRVFTAAAVMDIPGIQQRVQSLKPRDVFYD